MNLLSIDFNEVQYFYKNPRSLVDYSQMQSFSLIKSSVEIFSYYGIPDFTAGDIRDFFEKLQLVQKKNNKVFLPSPKKIDGVLQCCLSETQNKLSFQNGIYHIVSWNHSGYRYEIEAAHAMNKL